MHGKSCIKGQSYMHFYVCSSKVLIFPKAKISLMLAAIITLVVCISKSPFSVVGPNALSHKTISRHCLSYNGWWYVICVCDA